MKGNTVLSGSEIKVQDRKIRLDERHLYLDCSLTQRQAESSPFLFRDLTELLDSGRLQDGNQENPMTVYLAPGVYWIAEPGDERICTAKPGDKLPYEKKVKCQWLFLEGLSQNPMDVVIAADKGQSHDCIGNYTMFHFEGDGLHLKNLTVGNYCNVDLVYPKDPSQNRKKRTSAVTQAQLGDVEGDCFFAENCRFISRLNLYPFCGAKRSLYDRCHFESTDDALNGNAVYLECDFDFYGGRPLACTQGAGCVFLDCLFRIRGIRAREEADQYFMKGQGTVYLIRCRFVDEDGDGVREKDGRKLVVRWLTYPSRQELPLLAESAQATLKQIGAAVDIQCTADHNRVKKDRSAWDVYASAMVTAPSGDPQYFFTYCCLDGSDSNTGRYHSDALEELARKMEGTFDPDERGALAAQMAQTILDDHAYVFCSHLKMSMIARKGVVGLAAHPCDFYEITADLDKT